MPGQGKINREIQGKIIDTLRGLRIEVRCSKKRKVFENNRGEKIVKTTDKRCAVKI